MKQYSNHRRYPSITLHNFLIEVPIEEDDINSIFIDNAKEVTKCMAKTTVYQGRYSGFRTQTMAIPMKDQRDEFKTSGIKYMNSQNHERAQVNQLQNVDGSPTCGERQEISCMISEMIAPFASMGSGRSSAKTTREDHSYHSTMSEMHDPPASPTPIPKMEQGGFTLDIGNGSGVSPPMDPQGDLLELSMPSSDASHRRNLSDISMSSWELCSLIGSSLGDDVLEGAEIADHAVLGPIASFCV